MRKDVDHLPLIQQSELARVQQILMDEFAVAISRATQLLTAPWVREKLESMSGASTVRPLQLSALRSLTLPIPTAEECAQAESALADIASVREQIAEHQRNLTESRRQLWAQLWQIPEDFGDQ